MPSAPFTLRQLEVFGLLCELRSFRGASEQLGISQASVSNQLKALEQQLGVRLLVRESGRRPQLTPEGALFLADLGEFWNAAHRLAAHCKAEPVVSAEPRHLRVLIGNYLLKDYVRPKLHQFFESHPNIHLNFVLPTINEFPRDLVARDRFDLAMFQEPLSFPLGAGYSELAQVRCGVFGHFKFADRRNGELPPDELSELPWLLPPVGTFYELEILRMLREHGIAPRNITGRSPFFDLMSTMYDRGASIGVTIEPLLRPDEHRNTILLKHLENYRLALYRNPETTDPAIAAAEAFIVSAVIDDPAYPRADPIGD